MFLDLKLFFSRSITEDWHHLMYFLKSISKIGKGLWYKENMQSSRKSSVLIAKISLGPPFEHLASDPLSDCSFQEKNVCYGPLRDCGMLSDFVKCRTTKSFEGPAEICLSVLCLTEKLKVSWTLVGAILLNVGGSGGGGTRGIWPGTTLSN